MDRYNLLGRRWECGCGLIHEVPTRRLVIEKGALARTPHIMKELGIAGNVFLLADKTTNEVAGKRLSHILGADGFGVACYILSGRPYADDVTADDVASSVPAGVSAIVSCGSGTITDLAKWAAFQHGLAHAVVATAPSMNGFASGIVALTKGGLKSTQVARPPLAVICDIDILQASPIEMIRAGLGDLMSKPVCNADWKLASIVRGGHFCTYPFDLVRDLEGLYMRDAKLVPSRDAGIISALTEALVFSGISMVIAGSSAPASGGEHLIAHLIDMTSLLKGREHDLHGAEVGVASIATAGLYETIVSLKREELDSIALSTLWERSKSILDRCRKKLGGLAPAIEAEFRKKMPNQESAKLQAKLIQEKWDEIVAQVKPFLTSPSNIRTVLSQAGAKTTFSELGLRGDELRDVLEMALCIRNRYTILDLAFATGKLDVWVEEIGREDETKVFT